MQCTQSKVIARQPAVQCPQSKVIARQPAARRRGLAPRSTDGEQVPAVGPRADRVALRAQLWLVELGRQPDADEIGNPARHGRPAAAAERAGRDTNCGSRHQVGGTFGRCDRLVRRADPRLHAHRLPCVLRRRLPSAAALAAAPAAACVTALGGGRGGGGGGTPGEFV